MNLRCFYPVTLWLLLQTVNCPAGILYVDLNSPNPVAPYTNWATAATNIQDAVDAASMGDTVLVTDGIYATGGRPVNGTLTNRVGLTKALHLQSVNGPSVTVIQGYQMPAVVNGDSAVRCVSLVNTATLIGFTITNGATRTNNASSADQSGGGIWCQSANVIISNCVICGNAANGYGAGVLSGTLHNCLLTGNTSSGDGGGAAMSTLSNCTVTANVSPEAGGAYDCILTGCAISSNRASTVGGGVGGSSILTNCTVFANSATGSAGSGGGADTSTLINCILNGNSAHLGGGTDLSTLYNCVVTSNTAALGGGSWEGTLRNCVVTANTGGGIYQGALDNTILYFNVGSNYYGSPAMNYCCTTPVPGGLGNFANAPLFVNRAGADFHPQSNSPCINAGNNAYALAGPDLDGNPRIVAGTVDVGPYEFQNPVSTISYAWLQQYGLPINTNTDASDPDQDGADNYQEWRAGTDPTNPLSVLIVSKPVRSGNNPIITWSTTSNHSYYIQRSTNLTAQPAFSPLGTNLFGPAGSTSYTYRDTTATNDGPYFYRVGVE